MKRNTCLNLLIDILELGYAQRCNPYDLIIYKQVWAMPTENELAMENICLNLLIDVCGVGLRPTRNPYDLVSYKQVWAMPTNMESMDKS